MLIHSTTTFDIAVASHRARVASATRNPRVETPQRSPWNGASAEFDGDRDALALVATWHARRD